MLRRFPETKEELQLLVNILSMRVADDDVVQFGLKMCGRRSTLSQENQKYCYFGHT